MLAITKTGTARADAHSSSPPRWNDAATGSISAMLDWIESCGDAVVALDRAGRILCANAAFARTFGIASRPPAASSAAEATEPLSDRVPLLTGPRLARWIAESAAQGDTGMPRIHRLLAEGVRADGERLLLSATLVRTRGKPAHRSPEDEDRAACCIVGLRAVDAGRHSGVPSTGAGTPRSIDGPDDETDGVALGPLVDAAIRSLPDTERRRQCEVSLHADAQHLPVDPDAVRHALLQVLSNACRYSMPDTPIRIRSRLDAADGARFAVLTVADRGIGMRRADVPRAFEPFWRADDANPPSGHGLGLPIARFLLEDQGGWIELRSALGVGTEVEIWLPASG